MTTTPEGGGHTCTCPCGWLQWHPVKRKAAEALNTHAKTCKHTTTN